MRPDKLYKHTLCCLYPDVLKLCNRKQNSKTRQRMFPDFPELLLESESQKA